VHRFALAAVVLALSLAAFVSCGGGSGDDEVDGDDGTYVATICSTVRELSEELAALQDGAALASALDDLTDAIERAAGQLDDVDPPADVREQHDDLVELFRDASDGLRDGDAEAIAALFQLQADAFEPPEGARERLAAAAAAAPECEGMGIFAQ
jgi:hypothetical protein